MPRIVEPSELPVTLAELRQAQRVKHAREESYETQCLAAAVDRVQRDTHRQLMPALWRDYLTMWGCEGYLRLQASPVQSLQGITYLDTAGERQTLSTSVYEAYTFMEPAQIRLAYGQSWPSIRTRLDTIQVDYLAGYTGRDYVPPLLKQAIVMLAGTWLENRELAVTGTIVADINPTYQALISQYIVWDHGYESSPPALR